jgi:hydrogenase 3 maturation protease
MGIQEQLATLIQGNVVIMGIGNPCRGDDAAGSLVARQIREAPGARVIDAQDVPEHYLRPVVNSQPDAVVLIDSVDLDSAPGSIALLQKDQVADYWPSTHRVPMCLLMDYLERETSARIFLVAIQPRQTVFLGPVSEEVHASVARIARMLNRILETRRIPAHVVFADPWKRKVPA